MPSASSGMAGRTNGPIGVWAFMACVAHSRPGRSSPLSSTTVSMRQSSMKWSRACDAELLRHQVEQLALEPRQLLLGEIAVPGVDVHQLHVLEADRVQHDAVFGERGRMIGNALQLDEIDHVGAVGLRPLHPVAAGQPAARLQHAMHLAQQGRLVLHMQPGVLGEHHVEAGVGERQRLLGLDHLERDARIGDAPARQARSSAPRHRPPSRARRRATPAPGPARRCRSRYPARACPQGRCRP